MSAAMAKHFSIGAPISTLRSPLISPMARTVPGSRERTVARVDRVPDDQRFALQVTNRTARWRVMQRFALTILLSLTALAAIPAAAGAAGVAYPDADWSQAWIPSSGGVTL